jgi:hypothetical protein
MKIRQLVLAVAVVAAPASVLADSPYNYVAGYFNHSSLGGFASDSGSGFGVRASGQFMDHAFAFGEYQSTSFDTGSDDGKFIRAGAGFMTSFGEEQVDVSATAEFLHASQGGGSNNGFGLHGGAVVHILEQVDGFAEVGYVEAGNYSGPEYLVGGLYNFTPQWSVFADFRRTDFGSDLGDATYNDVQVGVRFNFSEMMASLR